LLDLTFLTAEIDLPNSTHFVTSKVANHYDV